MKIEFKQEGEGKQLKVFELFVVIAIIVIFFGFIVTISENGLKKSRLSSASQTLRSIAPTIADCTIHNLPISAPDDSSNPKNNPCQGAEQYPSMGTGSSKGCMYNTLLAMTYDNISNAAIQIGCDCANTQDIATCATKYQCDATSGNCR